MQFYLFVPLIFAIFFNMRSMLRIFLSTIVTSISLTSYIWVDHSRSFGNLYYRIWQFFIGILTYYVGNNLMTSNTKSDNGIIKALNGTVKIGYLPTHDGKEESLLEKNQQSFITSTNPSK